MDKISAMFRSVWETLISPYTEAKRVFDLMSPSNFHADFVPNRQGSFYTDSEPSLDSFEERPLCGSNWGKGVFGKFIDSLLFDDPVEEPFPDTGSHFFDDPVEDTGSPFFDDTI